MLFTSKTVRDRRTTFGAPSVLENLDVVPMKQVEFPEFHPPSCILVEIENVIILKTARDRVISSKFLDPLGT